jgi:2-desacetyl-2-hydroxyethyl bacteriochlorophyllide A dehydrogenase
MSAFLPALRGRGGSGMRAVVFTAPEKMEIRQVADPRCGPGDVIVKVGAAGICGTDLHIFRNEYYSDFPIIAGHEFCGVVTEAGKDARGVTVGQRVAVDPNLYCGECDFCRVQQNNQCSNLEAVGVTRNGAFAEYVAVPARACYRLPDTLSDSQGAFVEPLSCVIHALGRLRVWPGDAVVIFGAGPMGLLLTQALRHSGASQVVVVEKQAERLRLSRQLGATTAVAAGADAGETLRRLAPHGFGIVVDATGVPQVIENAFGYLRPRGQFLQFGVAPNGATISLSPYDIFKNDWTIIGSFALCYTFDQAIAWLSNGVVDVRPLISHTLPLARFAQGFESFASGKTLKVQVLPGQ